MKCIASGLLAFVLLFGFSNFAGQRQNAASQPLEVTDVDGGSVVTELGFKIKINDGSSLRRHWYVVNDPSCPISLAAVGVKTNYHSQQYSGEYQYVPSGTLSAKVGVQAVEVRLMLFDVWGRHLRTLSATEVRDYAPNSTIDFSKTGTWRVWSENEVSEVLSVVSFAAAVRQDNGSIWMMDTKKLLGEVDRIKVKLSENDLTPEKNPGKP